MIVEEIKFSVNECRDHVWVEIPTDRNGVLLCGYVYRSQSNDTNINGCIQSTKGISQLIRTAYHRNPNLLIAGDFNYKDIDWKNEHAPREQHFMSDFIDTIQECFLFQHVTEPTRYREGDRSNTLDLILSSEEGMVCDLNYHPLLGESDHVCLTFNVSLTQTQRKAINRPKYNIFKINYESVREELEQYNWYEKLNSSFEKDYGTFSHILQSTLEKHSPLNDRPAKGKNIYMTTKAIRIKNAKCRVWKRFVATKIRYDKVKYIQIKNRRQALTRKLRLDYEQKVAINVKDKPKAFWKYANSRLKTRPAIPTLIKADGSTATTPTDKANTLNNFFASVFRADKECIPPTLNWQVQNLPNVVITPEIVHAFFVHYENADLVYDVIRMRQLSKQTSHELSPNDNS